MGLGDVLLGREELVRRMLLSKAGLLPEEILEGESAYDMASRLLKAQFREWENTFKPIEQKLLNQLSFNNPNILTEAVQQAQATAQIESGATLGMLSRQNRSLGIMPTVAQKKTTERIQNLSTGLNIASAKNEAREFQRNLDEQILMGVASGDYGSLVSGQ